MIHSNCFPDDASVTSLTVQLFTVKSIAHRLLEEEDAFFALTSFYRDQMNKRIYNDDKQLNLEQWIEDDEAEYIRMECVISGEYIIAFNRCQLGRHCMVEHSRQTGFLEDMRRVRVRVQ
jgi:hypothetical protein